MADIDPEVQQRYLESPNLCPICQSEDIESTESVQVDGECAWQSIQCKNCHSTWSDIYILTGIDDLVDNLNKRD